MKKSIGSVFLAFVFITVLLSGCAPASTPVPPTSTFTPIPPTDTPVPIATLTPLPSPTSTPIVLTIIKDSPLYAGADDEGFETLAQITTGSTVKPLAKFGDFLKVLWESDGKQIEGFIPTIVTEVNILNLPELTINEVSWSPLSVLVASNKPLVRENRTGQWEGQTLLNKDLKIVSSFEVKAHLESKGPTGILIRATQTGSPWWKGQKRIEIFCETGTLGLFLRDGTSEEMAFHNNSNRPLMPVKDGVTTCQITLIFDKFGKNVEVFNVDGKSIYKINIENSGDFSGGLFPEGIIRNIEVSSGPDSSGEVNGKVNYLILSIPPDGLYQNK